MCEIWVDGAKPVLFGKIVKKTKIAIRPGFPIFAVYTIQMSQIITVDTRVEKWKFMTQQYVPDRNTKSIKELSKSLKMKVSIFSLLVSSHGFCVSSNVILK